MDTAAIRTAVDKHQFKYTAEFLSRSDIEQLFEKMKTYNFEISEKEYYITNLYNSYMKDTFINFGGKMYREIQFDYGTHDFTNIIDYFQDRCRFKCKRSDATMIPYLWVKNRANLFNVFRAILNDGEKINDRMIYRYSCRLMAKLLCPEFQPLIVSGLFRILNNAGFATRRFLDMSAGRGSRLMAAILNCDEYLGFDPDSCLHRNYAAQIKFAGGDPRKFRVIHSGFELAKLEAGYWDIMFSSPPYFDLEQYSEEKTQSTIKFKNLESWSENFVFPSVKKIFEALKSGGIMAVNISNSFFHPEIHYTEKFFDAAKKYGFKYLGIVGFSFASQKIERCPTYPIWIFSKS